MSVLFFKKASAKQVDLGTKFISKYTSSDKNLEINHMIVRGRHPENPNHFVLEQQVHFMMYIMSGEGKVTVDNETYYVQEGDVLDVPAKTRFAVESITEELKYLVAQSPAWSAQQALIVDARGEFIENTTI